jgi:putative sigma-54 modulation protein
MNIKINAVKFSADQKLESFVNNKVLKLSKFYDGILGAEVFLRVVKPQAEENKVAEIRLEIPGYDLFAKKQSDTFEESVDMACDAIKKQITRHKEKVKGV